MLAELMFFPHSDNTSITIPIIPVILHPLLVQNIDRKFASTYIVWTLRKGICFKILFNKLLLYISGTEDFFFNE